MLHIEDPHRRPPGQKCHRQHDGQERAESPQSDGSAVDGHKRQVGEPDRCPFSPAPGGAGRQRQPLRHQEVEHGLHGKQIERMAAGPVGQPLPGWRLQIFVDRHRPDIPRGPLLPRSMQGPGRPHRHRMVGPSAFLEQPMRGMVHRMPAPPIAEGDASAEAAERAGEFIGASRGPERPMPAVVLDDEDTDHKPGCRKCKEQRQPPAHCKALIHRHEQQKKSAERRQHLPKAMAQVGVLVGGDNLAPVVRGDLAFGGGGRSDGGHADETTEERDRRGWGMPMPAASASCLLRL